MVTHCYLARLKRRSPSRGEARRLVSSLVIFLLPLTENRRRAFLAPSAACYWYCTISLLTYIVRRFLLLVGGKTVLVSEVERRERIRRSVGLGHSVQVHLGQGNLVAVATSLRCLPRSLADSTLSFSFVRQQTVAAFLSPRHLHFIPLLD